MSMGQRARRGGGRRAALTLLGACWAAAAAPAAAQEGDEAAVRAVVDRIFAGMHAADSARVRSTMAPGVRFAVVDDRGAAPTITFEAVDGWLGALAASAGRWREAIYDVEVRVDGPLASVWAPYTFYLDGRVLHCGVDSIEMMKGADGWRVTQLADSRRTEGCPDPGPG